MTLPYLHPSMGLADVLDTVVSPEISNAGGGSVLSITHLDIRRHLLATECAKAWSFPFFLVPVESENILLTFITAAEVRAHEMEPLTPIAWRDRALQASQHCPSGASDSALQQTP